MVVLDGSGDPTLDTAESFFKNEYKTMKPAFYVGSGKKGSGVKPNTGARGPNTLESQYDKAVKDKDVQRQISLKNRMFEKNNK